MLKFPTEWLATLPIATVIGLVNAALVWTAGGNTKEMIAGGLAAWVAASGLDRYRVAKAAADNASIDAIKTEELMERVESDRAMATWLIEEARHSQPPVP